MTVDSNLWKDLSPSVREQYMILLDSIPTGKQNAVSMKNLARRLDVKKRALRLMILRARQDGCLICSGDVGYFQPAGVDDLLSYYYQAKSRLVNGLTALRPVCSVLMQMGVELK